MSEDSEKQTVPFTDTLKTTRVNNTDISDEALRGMAAGFEGCLLAWNFTFQKPIGRVNEVFYEDGALIIKGVIFSDVADTLKAIKDEFEETIETRSAIRIYREHYEGDIKIIDSGKLIGVSIGVAPVQTGNKS